MKDWKYKVMNEAQIAEVEGLWEDHGDAITAYGLECVNGYKTGEALGSMLGVAVGGLVAGLSYLGVKAYKKWKSKKKEPENEYEDKYEYIVV